MIRTARRLAVSATVAILVAGFVPTGAQAQGRGRGGGGAQAAPAVDTLSLDVKLRIREFYQAHPVEDAKPLPPGIRRNLARGKPLPPGIAKKTAPEDVRSVVSVPEGFELVEVGLDVLLVEVATDLIHDVLRDVIGA